MRPRAEVEHDRDWADAIRLERLRARNRAQRASDKAVKRYLKALRKVERLDTELAELKGDG